MCVCVHNTCFELAGKAKDLGVGRKEVRVQFAHDEQLRSPVLCVERSLLQLQKTVPGSL